MITEKQFNDALLIVNQYINQINLKALEIKNVEIEKSMFEIETGDYIKCVKVYSKYKNQLTENKTYRVIDFYDNYHNGRYFYIFNDENKRRKFHSNNSQFIFEKTK